MSADLRRSEPHRRRPGTVERPVNARLYRGTWLLVALPLLLAAFSVAKPAALPPPNLPPAFDRDAALALAQSLAESYPNRVPGTAGATGAARWFSEQLAPYGFRTSAERFRASVAGLGNVPLTNVVAVVPGRSERTIVVSAHRDDTGSGSGAVDNASGTAALIELARAYGNSNSGTAPRVRPNFTIVFLSTDGGASGGLGAAQFAAHSPYRSDVVAVLNLDAIASGGPARLELAGDTPRSPAASLVRTVADAVSQQTGAPPRRASALRQLIDLGFPFSAYEQAPFVARGIPAVTLTTSPDRPRNAFGDTPATLRVVRLGQAGRAAQNVLDSLDQGLDLAQGTSSYVYLGSRIIRGWAIELVLIAMLLPYLACVVDLFARCRRRRIPIAPALRGYRSRLGFWAWSAAVFLLFGLLGIWPGGAARPPALDSRIATHLPKAGLLGLAILMLVGWFVGRQRLIPRRRVTAEETLAGVTAALLSLSVVALLVTATNPFALLFLLPSLHVWLWLPHASGRSRWLRTAVIVCGFAGPALLVGSFAFRYGLGLHAPWYIAELFSLGYAPFSLLLIGVGWIAGAAQLVAVAGGRYAPYPSARERPPRGPFREAVHHVAVAHRRRRLRLVPTEREALEA
jgi:hypothetical protein